MPICLFEFLIWDLSKATSRYDQSENELDLNSGEYIFQRLVSALSLLLKAAESQPESGSA